MLLVSSIVMLDVQSLDNLFSRDRKLQDDLTDEMVGLARRLKESSLMMSRSVQDTEKVRYQSFWPIILLV